MKRLSIFIKFIIIFMQLIYNAIMLSDSNSIGIIYLQ